MNINKITPRNTNEGSIGAPDFNWGDSYFRNSNINSLSVSGVAFTSSANLPEFNDGDTAYMWANGNSIYWGNALISDGDKLAPKDLKMAPLSSQPLDTNGLLYNYNGSLFYGNSLISTGSGNNLSKFTQVWTNTSVSNGSTLTITHNLSSTDIICQVYVAKPGDDLADNPNSTELNNHLNSKAHNLSISGPGSLEISPAEANNGSAIKTLTSDAVSLQLGSNGYLFMSDSGDITQENFSGSYIKVVIIS